LYVARPSKLVKNRSEKVIKKIYDSDLKIEHKKFIVNKITGLCEKKYNRAQESKIFTDYDEAALLQKGTDMQIKPLTLTQKKVKLSKDEYETRKLLYGPDTPDFEKIPDHQVFLLCKKKEVTLSQGFLPIKFFIYDIMRLKMQKQYDKLTSEGAIVYGMNTDSLFINSNYQYPKENINKDIFSSIGKIRYDIGKTCHYKMFELKDNYDEIKLTYVPVQKVIQIKDEWDKAEFKEIFDNNTGVIVKAEIPGAGKTGVKCVRARVSLLLQEIEPALLFATNEYTSLFPVRREIQIFEFFTGLLLVKLDWSSVLAGTDFFQLLNVFCSNFLAFPKMLHS
jgi:hypothetical protein